MRQLTKEDLRAYLSEVGRHHKGSGRILLIGTTSHVWEGVVTRVHELEMTVEGEDNDAGKRADLEKTCANVAAGAFGSKPLALNLDSPADYIPLPDGYEQRMIEATDPPAEFGDRLALGHFDPYSVAFRFIARGDEPDYHVALASMACGWIDDDHMEKLLVDLLPRFSKETIAQDPAEFRRKYKGLTQLRKSTRPGQMHRFSPV